jgi:hypothetical protein
MWGLRGSGGIGKFVDKQQNQHTKITKGEGFHLKFNPKVVRYVSSYKVYRQE